MRFYPTRNEWGESICCVRFCGEVLPFMSAAPVCRKHGIEIGRVFWDVLLHEQRQLEHQHRQAREEKVSRELRKSGREVVYYVRIGDYVKIGYTRRLRERLRALRVSTDDLLAIEDGGRGLEAQRHKEFRGLRLGRAENFAPGDALMAHVAALGGRDSLPAWAKRPDTTRVQIKKPA